jgi:hypothetical protein
MANAFSILHNYDTPVYSPDFNFINAALSFKQNNLNANRANLQNLYDQFASLQVARDVDQKYIEDRLTQVRDITNKYASMDLSDPNFTASLMSNMTQVLDDNVKTAILSTKRLQAEDAEWKDKRKNKPELYSETNHQYALNVLSDRKRYMGSQEVGDTYQGGANFFEFRDTTKKFMDNLPNLEKFLGAKYFQTGPQEGYFRTIDTYEYIDQNRLRQATEMLFDEKDKLQMNSNAWAKYGRLDDEQLRTTFTGYMAPRVEDAKERLSSLETLYAKTTNSNEKVKLQAEIESAKQTVTTLESTTYDKITQAGGTQAVYTSIYKDEYLNGLVEPYDAPRLVDRKVDEVQKANIEFGLKVKEFELKRLKAEAEALKASEKETGTAPILGAEQIVGSEAERESNVNYALQEYNEALKSFRQVKGVDESGKTVELGNLTANEMLQIGKVLQGTDLSDKKVVELNVRGQKIKVNVAQNKEKLLEFKTYVLEDSPAVKQANAKVLQQMKKVEQRLITVSNYDNNQAIAQLPNLNKKFVKRGDKFVLENTGEPNYVKNLLRAAKTRDLSEAEQLTVTMYSNYMYMIDPKVDKSIREQAFIANRKMLFDKVGDMKTIRSLPATLGEVEANFTPTGITTQARKAQGEIQVLQQKLRTAKTPTEKEAIQNQIAAKERYQQRVTLAKPIWQGIDPTAMFTVGRDPYLSSIGWENVGSNKSLTNLVTDVTAALKTDLDNVYQQSGLVPTVRSVIYDEKTSNYETLKALVGGNVAGNIEIIPQLDDDFKMQPEVKITFKEKGAKGTQQTIKLSAATLAQNGININAGYKTPYNARFDYAPALELGTMNVSPEKAARAKTLGLETFSPEYIQDRIQQAAAYGAEFEQLVKNQMRLFKTGAYSVKMLPNSETGFYDFVLLNENGKEIHRQAGDRSELSVTDAAQAVTGDEGLVIKNNLFSNYLDNFILSIQEQSLYKSSDETIRDLLQY